MKKKILYTGSFLIIATLAFSCRESEKEENPKNENKNNAAAGALSRGEKYFIDTKETVLTWEGSMVFGFEEEHKGYVYASTGELMIENDQLVGGTAEIDMNTMEYGDKENKNTPIQHLKSADYFDVEKFPVSTFSITSVDYAFPGNVKVTGDLTIRGVTKPITFPARIEVKDGIARADGKVTIDRTQWGIRYRSGTFYDNLPDQAVADEIQIQMKIVAKQYKDNRYKLL